MLHEKPLLKRPVKNGTEIQFAHGHRVRVEAKLAKATSHRVAVYFLLPARRARSTVNHHFMRAVGHGE